MMINELPKSTATIATTYFENVDDQSQFKKEMDYNMKLLSGLDPATTNQEIYEMNRQQEDAEIYGGTEQALLNIDDSEVRGFLANRMETFGAVRRSNPDLALQDFYTSTEEANRIVTDDVYRINYTNSKEDPHIYDTKYVIGMQKIYEAMENMEPNYGRLAFRYIGQPALSIGMGHFGGVLGAGVSDSLIAGWDSLALGGTIYNTQEKFVNAWHELLSDKSLTQEQFAQGVDDLVSGILMLDPAYQEEIFSAMVQSPNPFADGGLTFTSFGLKTFAQPLGALARMAKKPIGYFGKSSVFKRMELNEKLVDTIKKEMSNKVDEDIVNENINTKVSQVAPEDVSEKTVETVKGIMKDEETDNKVLKNSNEDYSYSDISVTQEDIDFHNTLTSEQNRIQTAEEQHQKNVQRNLQRQRAGERGEIRLGEPKQNYFIRRGKGINNDPMTWEEVQKKIVTEQGRGQEYIRYDLTEPGSLEYNPDNAPKMIQIQTASPNAWSTDPNVPGRFDYEGHHPGERGQAYGGGGYAGVPDSGGSSAEVNYFGQFDRNKVYNKPKEIIKFSDGKSQEFFSYRQDLLAEPKDTFFEKDNKYYKKALELADPNGEIESKIPGYNRTYFTDSITDIGRYIKAFENDEDMMKALKISLESNKDFVNDHLMNEHSFREYNTKPTVLIGEFLKRKDKHYPEEFVKEYTKRLDNYKERLKKDLDTYEDLKKSFNFSDKEMFELDSKLTGFTAAEDWDAFFKNLNLDPESLPNRVWDILFSIREDVSEVIYSQSMLDQLKIIKPKLDNLLKKGFTFEEEHPLNYKTTLNTHLIKNPEADLDTHLWWDKDNGIQPVAYFYKGKKARAIEDKMYEKISSINNEIAEGIDNKMTWSQEPIEIRDERGNGELLMTFSPKDSWPEISRKMSQLYINMNKKAFDSLGLWENLMREYVYDRLTTKEKGMYYDFKDWYSKYLTKHGIDMTWHRGFSAGEWNNVVVHNTNLFKDVTKVETDIKDFSKRIQYLYNNGHGYESVGDGVGYYEIEAHGIEGSKPIIIEGGKVVDFGDYKPYNSKK